ncbi:MAG: CBS domain-containing protein [Acidovorax sp.]|nr:CBS domain-containing protein [Acidovorax sp.]
MFFVFGPSGQMFRGGPENLSRISAVRSVQAPAGPAHPARWRARKTPLFPVHRVRCPQPVRTPLRALPSTCGCRMPSMPMPRRSMARKPARQPLTRVSDVMTVGGLSVPPDTRVNDAWQTLAENHVAQAPVVDALGRVIGLLLRADMAPLDLLPEPGAIKQAIELARRPVSEVMLSPVPTVAADTALRRVAAVLLDTGLPGLPVTDEAGVLAGFISRTDILRAVAADPPLDLWSGPATAL